jgi:hypothetical protein
VRERHGRALVPAAGGGVQDGDARAGARGQRLDGDDAAAGLGEQQLVVAGERAQPPPPPGALGAQPRTPLLPQRREPEPADSRELHEGSFTTRRSPRSGGA